MNHNGRVVYCERPTQVPGAVLWQRRVRPGIASSRILPDGCLDLVWDGHRLLVAGPDSIARWQASPGGASYVGLRFAGGLGPALLDIRADEVLDRTADLEEVWPAAEARRLSEHVAADPVAALEGWAIGRARVCALDPLGPRVFAMAAAEVPVAEMAERLALSVRQVHRRCLPVFGYGPRRLSRVLRLGRALDEARSGLPLVQVAYDNGYVDQAHLNREVRALAGTTPTVLISEGDPAR
jgi:AraC-like DNA-binding protein